jgi:glutathione synthase/RimK-type ligase-like ATP-grasp enzyme
MSKDLPVLIVTSSVEEHSYGPVCRTLAERQAPFVVFLTDRVLEDREHFRLDINEAGVIVASYKRRRISPGEVGSAWYWKPASFRVRDAETNVSKQMTMVNEVTAVHRGIWSLYPEAIWLSSPASLWRAERKLAQLVMARRVGFNIPRTLVSNDWDDIANGLVVDDAEFIVKMARGVLADQNVVKGMQTKRLDGAAIEKLRHRAIPFPGFYQPYVKKAREWRVTVVAEDVFAAAIYTDESAKDDWRQHQLGGAVRFEPADLPDSVADHCVSFLSRMELGYGAFDLIETPDGEVVFLECNPSGQFSWLEETLGLPVSRALAASLLRKRGDSG